MPTLAEAFVDIIGRDTGLAKAMGKAEKDVNSSTAKMQARLNQFGNGMKAIGSKMSLALTAPIAAMATVSVKAFAEEEDALNRLQAALANTGSVTDGAMERYRAFASEVQKATVYGDELIISTMAYGHNLGIQASQLEDAAKAAAGLAAKYRLDLQTAMMLLGRASQGNTMMLKRYGITLDDTLTPQEKFNQLLKIGASNFGLAEAEARTTSGQLKQLKNQFSDLQEEIGAALAPMLKKLVADMKSLVSWFQGLSTQTKNSIVQVGLFVAALGPLLVVIGQMALGIKALSTALIFLNANPIVLAITLIATLTAGIWLAVKAFDAMGQRSAKVTIGADANDMDALTDRAEKLRKKIKQLQEEQDKVTANNPIARRVRTGYQSARLDYQEELKQVEAAIKAVKEKRDQLVRSQIEQGKTEDEQAITELRNAIARRGMSEIQALQFDKANAVAAAGTPGLKAATAADYDDQIARAKKRIADEGAAKLAQAQADAIALREQQAADQRRADEEALAQRKAAMQGELQTRRSAWEEVLSMSESFTIRMTELAQGETAARMKAIDLETAKRREAIEQGVRDETRKAMLLKALDLDVAAQKQALTDEEARKANEQAKAEAESRRNRIGFAGSLGDVWRSAMTAGARLGVPDAPAVQTAKYSKEQVDLLKQIAEYTQGQLDLAKTNVNKLSAAEALL